MPTNTPTAPPVASRLRVSPAVLRRTVTSFAGLMGLTNGADCASTASASPMMGVPSASPQPASAAPAPPPAICATHAELADIAAIHFSAAEGRCEALAGAYCAGLLDTLGASVGVLADAGARALLMARDGEFAEDRAGSSSSSASLPQQCSSNSSGSDDEEGIAADVHVAFLPNDGQWTARVTVRDAKALRRAAAFVYVSAFINEGRVGGSLVDYATTEATSRSGNGSASSGGNDLVLSALRQLRRAEASAVAAAAAVRLQRLQDAAAAEKCAGGAAGSRAFAMGRRRAVGLDFLGDDGVGAVGGLFGGVADSAADQQQQPQSPKSPPTDATSAMFSTSSPSNNEATRPQQQQRANATNEAAVAALRKTSVALIAQSTFRCSLAHVPLWASVRRAVEESLLGGLGSSEAEGSSSPCLSVREGAVLALERAWGSAAVGEKKGGENPNYTVQSLRGANGIPFRYTVSCSFDVSPATNAAVGAKRPRATAASSAASALPDFPPPAVDGSVLAVFLCDGETGAMVRESGVGTASSRAGATTSGGQQKSGDVASPSDAAAAPEKHAAEAPQQPPQPQPLALSVVHFMVQDDGRNRVDFVNAML